MKHSDGSDAFRAGTMLRDLGVIVEAAVVAECIEHLDWVRRTNATHNLTTLTEGFDAVRLHVVDSLAALNEVSEAPAGALADIGTGGGFPGLPLCLASQRRAVLIDSVRKKVLALQQHLDSTPGRGISVYAGRSEDLALERPNEFAVVVARAVAELPVLVELASPLLQDGGRLVALKGAPTDEELARGSSAATIVGMQEIMRRAFSLPEGGETRTIVTYVKVDDPSVPVPRRPGMAKKRPLA